MIIKNTKIKKIAVFFIIFILSMGLLTGCNNNAKNTENQETSNNEQIAGNRGIYSYKTEYVGDNTKVVKIASEIAYPEGIKYDSVRIISDKEPYGLIVYLNKDKDSENPDLFNQAVMTFALIDNLSNIKYELKDTDEIIEEFNREDLNVILRENGKDEINSIGSSEENFNKFLENEKNV